MKFTCLVLVVSTLTIHRCRSDENTTTRPENETAETESTETRTEPIATTEINYGTETTTSELESVCSRGLYGGAYCNYSFENPKNIHYIHGVYQSPIENYYTTMDYNHEDENDTALDYYLGFGISKMTDENFQYEDFHHYYHDLNRNISENESIRMDHIIACHPNATFLCPENTETVCLLNGTIYCMSKISVVESCHGNESTLCVNSMVPCVRNCESSENYLEKTVLPCLATVIVVDIYEDRHGMTISKVGGTFILVPALGVKDRLFCVSVIVDPVDKNES